MLVQLTHQVLEFLNSHQTHLKIKQLHALVITTCLSRHPSLATKVLRLYAINDDLPSARMLFDQSPKRSVYLWNSMIRAYAKAHSFASAFSLFTLMWSSDTKPDSYTFACILRACAEKPDPARAKMTHGSMILSGIGSNLVASSALVSAYSKLGLIDEASCVFSGVLDPDLVLWNSMVSAYGYRGFWQKGLEMFHRMRISDEKPDGYSLVGLLSCFWDPSLLQIGRGIHGFCLKCGFDTINHVRSILVSMYSRCKCLASAYRVFSSLSQPDLVLWSAMITGFSQTGECEKALSLFSEMSTSGRKPDPVLVASVLSACASLATVRPGKEIHGYVSRLGIDLDVQVSCALMDMYVKCGFSQLGFHIFEMMPEKNATAYNIVISGLGSHGLGHKAIKIFEEMLDDGLKPDEATFSALLCACCHSVLIKDGRDLFRRMQDDFGIQAQMEHYVYMVKLLGMVGELHEAYELIRTMPMLPDSGVWGALLWCCSVHGHLELAEIVGHRLFEIEPRKTAYRVILSNIHAAEGNWGDVESLRDDIMEEGLRKIPGLSWIGDGNI